MRALRALTQNRFSAAVVHLKPGRLTMTARGPRCPTTLTPPNPPASLLASKIVWALAMPRDETGLAAGHGHHAGRRHFAAAAAAYPPAGASGISSPLPPSTRARHSDPARPGPAWKAGPLPNRPGEAAAAQQRKKRPVPPRACAAQGPCRPGPAELSRWSRGCAGPLVEDGGQSGFTCRGWLRARRRRCGGPGP